MLYYRMYTAMKKNFGFHSANTFSPDYATFVVLIPTFAGFIFGAFFKLLKKLAI